MSDGLKYCGIPLGGLGTGSVELRQDGYFHEWQIMNNFPWGTGPRVDLHLDTSFFGLQIHGKDINRSAILGLVPPRTPTFSCAGFYLNDPFSMPWQRYADSIDVETQVPFTRLKYNFSSLPIEVELESFSPFVPLDTKNSALPMAFFTFKLKNKSSKALQISLFNAQRNIIGYTKPDSLSEMKYRSMPKGSFIGFKRKGLPAKGSDNGTMVTGVFSGHKADTSFVLHTRSVRDIWDPLRKSGFLENKDISQIEKGNHLLMESPIGALCQTLKLSPKSKAEITFTLAWHFPNQWEADYKTKNVKGSCIGHKYSEWFTNAESVFEYCVNKFKKLKKESLEFVQAFYQSSLPKWFLDSIAAQFTTLIKSSWWDRKGRFGIWEGLGCCGLQTTDITFCGSFPIVQFFPELQKSQMFLTQSNIEVPGKIPHAFIGTFACCDDDIRNRLDLNPQFILLIWRDVLWSGDMDYLKKMWPTIKDTIEWYKTVTGSDGLLPYNKGKDSTYDQFPFVGTSSYIGFLHAASLLATAQMAEIIGETDTAIKLKEQFSQVESKLQEQLWNGKCFQLCYDPITGIKNEGVMTDQIVADWFMRQTCGYGILPDKQVKSALKTIFKECSTEYGYIANCSWTKGDDIEISRYTIDQAKATWTGVEFSLAAHLVLMGMEKQAFKIVRNIWERYERAGLRFDHIECGGHYYRALSAWAVYLALSGFSMNALSRSITISIRKKTMAFLVCTPTAWGRVKTQPIGKLAEIVIQRGSLSVKRIKLKHTKANKLKAVVDDKTISCYVEKTDQGPIAVFESAINLKPNKAIKIFKI